MIPKYWFARRANKLLGMIRPPSDWLANRWWANTVSTPVLVWKKVVLVERKKINLHCGVWPFIIFLFQWSFLDKNYHQFQPSQATTFSVWSPEINSVLFDLLIKVFSNQTLTAQRAMTSITFLFQWSLLYRRYSFSSLKWLPYLCEVHKSTLCCLTYLPRCCQVRHSDHREPWRPSDLWWSAGRQVLARAPCWRDCFRNTLAAFLSACLVSLPSAL